MPLGNLGIAARYRHPPHERGERAGDLEHGRCTRQAVFRRPHAPSPERTLPERSPLAGPERAQHSPKRRGFASLLEPRGSDQMPQAVVHGKRTWLARDPARPAKRHRAGHVNERHLHAFASDSMAPSSLGAPASRRRRPEREREQSVHPAVAARALRVRSSPASDNVICLHYAAGTGPLRTPLQSGTCATTTTTDAVGELRHPYGCEPPPPPPPARAPD